MISNEQLEELERLDKAATVGSWRASRGYENRIIVNLVTDINKASSGVAMIARLPELDGEGIRNALLIEAMRNNFADLLAEVRRLQEHNNQAQSLIAEDWHTIKKLKQRNAVLEHALRIMFSSPVVVGFDSVDIKAPNECVRQAEAELAQNVVAIGESAEVSECGNINGGSQFAGEQLANELDRMKIMEIALDILGEVAEGKRLCGGYPAINWAKAEAELAQEKE